MKWAQAIALLLAAWVESSEATETIVPAVILGYPEIIQSRIAAIEKSGQRRMKFNLRSIGAKGDQWVYATVQGPLTDDEVIAVLRVVPLIQHVRSLVGRWRLSVVGDRGFARVAVSLLWPCRDDRYRDWDWVLAATNADSSATGTNATAIGAESVSSGLNTTAIGYQAVSSGPNESIAIGSQVQSTASGS